MSHRSAAPDFGVRGSSRTNAASPKDGRVPAGKFGSQRPAKNRGRPSTAAVADDS